MSEVQSLVKQYNDREAEQSELLKAIISELQTQSGPRSIKVAGKQLMNAQLSERALVASFVGRVAAPILEVVEGSS